jgi:hypothetical protein
MITKCGLRRRVVSRDILSPFQWILKLSYYFYTLETEEAINSETLAITSRKKNRDNIRLDYNSSFAYLLQLVDDCSDYDYFTCIGVSKVIS